MQRPHRVHSSVDDSALFDHLESTWALRPGPSPGTTWLVFRVDFAFRSALHRTVAELFFDQARRLRLGPLRGKGAVAARVLPRTAPLPRPLPSGWGGREQGYRLPAPIATARQRRPGPTRRSCRKPLTPKNALRRPVRRPFPPPQRSSSA
jgi:hypothetical protein